MESRSRVLKRLQALADEPDWEQIYTDLLPRVYNFFRYRVGDTTLAEDLTAVTFEKAWRRRKRYRRDLAAFSTWLFTIARNVAIDHFRRNHHESELREAGQPVDPSNPEEINQRRSDFERLSLLLSQLPKREQDLVSLKYGAGLTNREIASLVGLSESNVGTILHRTVEKLRAAWEV